ncbi:LppU/SCO3897 family protein [Streptomyces platensis]|uniref:LppU/SCO3897 family protein n=1 Tax=Streptomyces platensis TaxID=58346 RepID=UPI0033233EDB
MSAYSPPPQGPAPYGRQPGPAPYGPPAGHGGPAPYGPPATGPFVHGQPPAYAAAPVQQTGAPMFTPTGPERRPWLRPLIALGVLAAVFGGFGVLTLVTDDGKPPQKSADDAVAGDCLDNHGTHAHPNLFTVPCGDAKADYKVMFSATLQGKCPPEFDEYTERGGRGGDTTLCLTRVRH